MNNTGYACREINFSPKIRQRPFWLSSLCSCGFGGWSFLFIFVYFLLITSACNNTGKYSLGFQLDPFVGVKDVILQFSCATENFGLETLSHLFSKLAAAAVDDDSLC